MTKFKAYFNNKEIEVEAESMWEATQKARELLRVPKPKIGLMAIQSVESEQKEEFRLL